MKQTHANRELIVVSDDTDWPEWVTVVETGVNETIPVKRNIAMASSNGDAITWFDDDDWQHPEKLHIIATHVSFRTNVGCSRSFFYDITSNKICEVNIHPMPIFNSIGVMRYGLPAFNENIVKGSDTDWLKKLSYRGNAINPYPMFFWVVHEHNTTLNREKINASEPARGLDGETWQHLMKLNQNLNSV